MDIFYVGFADKDGVRSGSVELGKCLEKTGEMFGGIRNSNCNGRPPCPNGRYTQFASKTPRSTSEGTSIYFSPSQARQKGKLGD